jgi:hypothetical protein
MILETAQLLCSAHHITDQVTDQVPYKLSHKNHPCSIWVRASLSNYLYLCELGLELCKEYTYRYGKIHKCEKEYLQTLCDVKPRQAMPEIYKINSESIDDAIEAYRNYYFFEKNHMFAWKNRDVPEWIKKIQNLFE